jgi:sugar phosphate isomerase/epimerase
MSPNQPDEVAVPEFAVSASSTWHQSVADDLTTYGRAGVDGIGIWEFKLPDGNDTSLATALEDSGLRATVCWPRVPGPLAVDVLFPGPADPRDRTKLLCESIRRLAVFDPLAIACLAEGDLIDESVVASRAAVVESLREASHVAADLGHRLALEVIRPGPGANLSTTIPAALELVADIGSDNLGILGDTWHFWDSPGAPVEIAQHGAELIAVQVNDMAADSEGWYDRANPGDGIMPLPSILATLDQSGFTGPYELELFSEGGPMSPTGISNRTTEQVVSSLAAARDGFYRVWRSREHAPPWHPVP